MFKFRLAKILSLKERMEEAKKNEYAKARKKLEDAINKKNALVEKKNNLVLEMQSLDGSVEKLQQRTEYNRYINYLKEVIQKLESNINFLRIEAEIKRQELVEAVKERKVLEKFKEKEYEKYKKEEQRIENELVNELVSYRFTVKEEE